MYIGGSLSLSGYGADEGGELGTLWAFDQFRQAEEVRGEGRSKGAEGLLRWVEHRESHLQSPWSMNAFLRYQGSGATLPGGCRR